MPGARSVALSVGFGVGSVHERTGEEGWAHLLEHLQISLDSALERGREQTRFLKSLGAEFNALTRADATIYELHVARRFWPAAGKIFAQALSEPSFDASSVAIERAIIAQESQQAQQSPVRQFFWNTLSHLFAGTPYAHAESLASYGTPASLAAASAERLAHWRSTAYAAGQAWVAAVGAIEHEEAEEWAASLSLPAGAGLERPDSGAWRPVPDTHLLIPSYPQTHLALSWPTFGAPDPRSLYISLISAWLGRGAGSRLFEEIRGRRGLAYELFTDHNQYSLVGAFQFVMETANAERANELIDVSRAIICDGHERISQDEFRLLSQELAGRMDLTCDSPATLCTLAGDQLANYGHMRQPKEIIERIEQADFNELREVWREFLTAEHMVLSRLN